MGIFRQIIAKNNFEKNTNVGRINLVIELQQSRVWC